MTESLSPLRERTYKLRTHSNVNIMFSRPSLLRNTDVFCYFKIQEIIYIRRFN